MNVLVTGVAGFIGYHIAQRLLARGERVIGIDNLNDYYSVPLKRARLARLAHPGLEFVHGDIADPAVVARAFHGRVDAVVHLAAHVGVRHSIEHPEAYVSSNLVGFNTVIDAARRHEVAHFLYASSSSVYGANTSLPFKESDCTDHPLNLYAATKKSNEVVARSYSHLFGMATTGLRFFTVYGPWGRPDMAVFQFTERIASGRPIQLFCEGALTRDFTYIDDIAAAVVGLVSRPSTSRLPARILNIGSQQSVEVRQLVKLIECALGKEASLELHPVQEGDMRHTLADVGALVQVLGPWPSTPIQTGLSRFVDWYRDWLELGAPTRDPMQLPTDGEGAARQTNGQRRLDLRQ